MTHSSPLTIALFYCRNVPGSGEAQRQAIEVAHGRTVRLFPLPCSGRLDMVHLMRALEEFADAAYLITCPEGTCRYFEGNTRAKKRVERTRALIESIGLEGERVGIVMESKENPKPLSKLVDELKTAASALNPSPVLQWAEKPRGRERRNSL
ncbi:MAG: hydrogenase iron-sulfur subunit [Deltaproteobacteria bacterium]|nr:hydrogenase iron-sulfur subunit [Deltaproteobacteria bacterium]